MKPIVFFFCLFLVNLAVPAGSELVRPSVTGIAYVRFYAKNVEQSRNFYNATLGLPVVTQTQCTVPDTKLCITINGNQELRITEAENDASANLVEIAFATPEADAMRRYLLKRGLHPTDITSRSSLNRQFSISDPEGHKITFVSQPEGYVAWGSFPSISRSLIHTGFVVNDRAAEDHFYKDILGFRPYWHGGMKDDKDDWVAMQVPDGTDWVEYMLNISPTADKHTLGVMNHIALGVEDIHETEKRLIANGWKPGEKPKIGRDGKWQLNLYDPDDTRVEFMEFTPKEKPCCSEFTGPHPGPKK